MIKCWHIESQAPVAGKAGNDYFAFAEENPIDSGILKEWEDTEKESIWDSYSYLTGELDIADYDSEEEYNEAYDQLYEDWMCDIEISAEEIDPEDMKDFVPCGTEPEIIYDERNEK